MSITYSLRLVRLTEACVKEGVYDFPHILQIAKKLFPRLTERTCYNYSNEVQRRIKVAKSIQFNIVTHPEFIKASDIK